MTDGRKKYGPTLADRLEGDKVVWIIVMMLILTSIVCMFSSTSRLLHGDMTRIDLVKGQLKVVGAGLAVIIICYNIKKISIFRWCAKFGFLISFLLLAMLDFHVKTPVVKALNINNAWRILSVAGVQIHVFEVVKVAMVLYFAWALDAINRKRLKWPKKLIWQKILFLFAPFLITLAMIIPGSNSSALFIGFIMFIVILLGGGNAKELFLLAFAGLLIIGICIGIYKLSDGKYMDRIGTGIERVLESDDWETQFQESPKGSLEYQEALDALRQPVSAKIAIKEGGFFGKGPGESTQRYVVPDMSEDYMFSFIVEEYGIWGATFVIFLYVSLLARASIIARNCGNDVFSKLTVAGLSMLITGQAFLHMFVNADIGPMTGQTLPLISHGNSAFLCFSLAFGIILSISRIAKKKIEKEQRQAEPLVETHESDSTRDGLNDLDKFESEENISDNEL